MQLTPYEQTIQVLGDRVMLKAVPKPSAIIQIDGDHKLTGDIVIVAVGDGPHMATHHSKLKVGARVAVTDMGFKEVVDLESKRVYRIYSAQDIIAILPEEGPANN